MMMDRCTYDRSQQVNLVVGIPRHNAPFTTSTSSISAISTSPSRMMMSNYGHSNPQHHQQHEAASELIANLHDSSMQRWHSLQDFVTSFGIKSNLSELHSTFLPRSSSTSASGGGGGGCGSDSITTSRSSLASYGGSSTDDYRGSSVGDHHDHAFQRSTSLTSLTSGFSSSRGSLLVPPTRAPPNSPVGFDHDESTMLGAYQIAYAQRPPGMGLHPRMTLPHYSPRKSSSSFEEMMVSSTSGCAGGGGGFAAFDGGNAALGGGIRFLRSGYRPPQLPTLGSIGGHRGGVAPPTRSLRDGPPLPPVAFNTATTPITTQVVSSGGGLSAPQTSIPPVHNRNYQEARYKTELCLHFREKNACPHGAHCLFAHGLSELRPYRGRHPKHKSQPCKSFHETGYCNYGYRCSYIHLESPGTIRYIKSLNDEAQKQRKFNKQQLVGHREHYHRY